MSNTLQSTVGVTYLRSGVVQFAIPARQQTQTLTSNIRQQGVQNIGTTEEAIELGGVASDNGPAFFFNRSAVNFVEIGIVISTVFYPVIRLPAGASCFLPSVSDKDLFARANTAAIDLEYFICEP